MLVSVRVRAGVAALCAVQLVIIGFLIVAFSEGGEEDDAADASGGASAAN